MLITLPEMTTPLMIAIVTSITSFFFLIAYLTYLHLMHKRKYSEESLVRRRIKQIMSVNMDLSDIDWTDKNSIKEHLLELNGKTYPTLTDKERTILNRAISLRFYRIDDVLSKKTLNNINKISDVDVALSNSKKVLNVKPKALDKTIGFGLKLLKLERKGGFL